jgi:hypothetical protein
MGFRRDGTSGKMIKPLAKIRYSLIDEVDFTYKMEIPIVIMASMMNNHLFEELVNYARFFPIHPLL